MKRTLLYLAVIVLFSLGLSMNTARFFSMGEVSLFVTVIGLTYGLMAAFTINNAWERFSKIRDAIAEEISSITDIYPLLRSLGAKYDGVARDFARSVIEYAREILRTEWHEYWNREEVHKKFDEWFDIVTRIDPETKREEVILDNILEALREASLARSKQLVLANTRISGLGVCSKFIGRDFISGGWGLF